MKRWGMLLGTVAAGVLALLLLPHVHAADDKGASDLAFDVGLKEAQRAVEASLAKAKAMGLAMNIAVVGRGGHLKAFARMDGALLGSVDISIRKANTAVLFKLPTRVLGEASQPGAPLYGIEHSNDGLVTFGGGFPIKNSGGDVIGAIGVSGSSVENDEVVAQAGIDQLKP